MPGILSLQKPQKESKVYQLVFWYRINEAFCRKNTKSESGYTYGFHEVHPTIYIFSLQKRKIHLKILQQKNIAAILAP